MIDSDNALLVRPVSDSIDMHAPIAFEDGAVLVATIYHPEERVGAAFSEFFDELVVPLVRAAGGSIVANYVTENAENTFQALPVRNVESFAWFAMFPHAAAHAKFRERYEEGEESAAIRARLALLKTYSPPEVWQLVPTGALRRDLVCNVNTLAS